MTEYLPPCESENQKECSKPNSREKNGYDESGFNVDNNEYTIVGNNSYPEINTIIISELLSRNNISSEFIIYLITSSNDRLNSIKLKQGEKIILEKGEKTILENGGPHEYQLSIGSHIFSINTVQNTIIEC